MRGVKFEKSLRKSISKKQNEFKPLSRDE